MAKIHYDELTVGVPAKASSVNYENADGTKESVQSKIEHMETVELTKGEYDALSYAEKHNGKDYLVKGMSPMTAYNMPYKDSTVGDGLDDIKQNIADLNDDIESLKNVESFSFDGTNLRFDKVGRQVMLCDVGVNSEYGSNINCPSWGVFLLGTLPLAFRPSSQYVYFPAVVRDSSIGQAYNTSLYIEQNGIVRIYDYAGVAPKGNQLFISGNYLAQVVN